MLNDSFLIFGDGNIVNGFDLSDDNCWKSALVKNGFRYLVFDPTSINPNVCTELSSKIVSEFRNFIVASPTEKHSENIDQIFSLHRDIRSIEKIIVEKPLCNIGQLDKDNKSIAVLADKICVNYPRNFDDKYNFLNDISCEELEVILHFQGGLHHNASHLLALLFHYFKDIRDISVVVEDRYVGTFVNRNFGRRVSLKIYDFSFTGYSYWDVFIISKYSNVKILNGGQDVFISSFGDSKNKYKNLVEKRHLTSLYGASLEQGLKKIMASGSNLSLEYSVLKFFKWLKANYDETN